SVRRDAAGARVDAAARVHESFVRQAHGGGRPRRLRLWGGIGRGRGWVAARVALRAERVRGGAAGDEDEGKQQRAEYVQHLAPLGVIVFLEPRSSTAVWFTYGCRKYAM